MERIPEKGELIQFLCNPSDKRFMLVGVVISGLIDSRAEIKMVAGQFLWGQYSCEIKACRILDINNLVDKQESFDRLIKAYPYLNKIICPNHEIEANSETEAKAYQVNKQAQPVMVDELLPKVVEAPICQGTLF